MGILKAIGFSVLIAALTPVTAIATAWNRATWLQMTPDEQFGYVVGVYAELLMSQTDDAGREVKFSRAHSEAYARCATELGLKPADLIKLVSDAYDRYPESWALPPNIVVRQQLLVVCKTRLDAERAKLGLSPLP